MGKKVSNHVTWVGKTDWELKSFHGNELSTYDGSSYNAYLVRGSEKTVLIDTVWQPYDKEFVSRLQEEVDLSSIDYIVMNHNEIDHSGSLPELMREIPDTPIYCTAKGESIIKGHYHPEDWNFVNVKTGGTLDLGDVTLTFVEAPMLHWPDTMFTYMDAGEGEHILFSNDGFGQHFASESLFDEDVNKEEVYHEAMKYWANILNLYANQAKKKINEILAMNLPLDMIAPSHGIIWKSNPTEIVEKYLEWADAYQENQVTIMYDTMWNSTRKIGEAIARGIYKVRPDITIKLFNASKEDKNDIVTEVFRSKAVLVGSPAINYGFMHSIGGMLEMIKGLRFKKKKAAAFGSYGWSGGVVKQMTEALKGCGFEIVNDGFERIWVPDEGVLAEAEEYGKQFAENL
ncbi:MBL fold metallo-hydrolase [Blautia liquoris]|uniref:MBL fold metallo-hydrolase n=1 Tax=Blautia liquoris TaxID=2779518 RepID=A0A7M2RJJ6_9FIRM|nr:MBL fold metallo-hydrolase [Blautia liquoris]QOV20308.1 MBL fold metallo-hydrolase [Blautia liquoris]